MSFGFKVINTPTSLENPIRVLSIRLLRDQVDKFSEYTKLRNTTTTTTITTTTTTTATTNNNNNNNNNVYIWCSYSF